MPTKRTIRNVCVAAALTAGCTNVNVLPYTGTEEGLHFSLPTTFLLVTPQADGTVGYKWVYLPDSDREYVIQQNSMLSKFTLDIKVTNGLLTSAGVKQDSSVIPAKLATDAGTLANAYVQAAQAAAQKKSSTKVSGADVIGGNTTPATPSAYAAAGPVLLRVVQDEQSVHLIPVEYNFAGMRRGPQPSFLTNQVVQADTKGGGAGDLKLTCPMASSMGATVTASQVIFAPKGPGVPTLHLSSRDIMLEKPTFKSTAAQTTVTLVFPSSAALTAGDYKVTIPYSPNKSASPGEDQSADVTCTIR
jgi:hypothetical protein